MAFMFISHFITEADVFYCSCSSLVSFLSDCFSSLNSHVIQIRHAEGHCWGCNLETSVMLCHALQTKCIIQKNTSSVKVHSWSAAGLLWCLNDERPHVGQESVPIHPYSSCQTSNESILNVYEKS